MYISQKHFNRARYKFLWKLVWHINHLHMDGMSGLLSKGSLSPIFRIGFSNTFTIFSWSLTYILETSFKFPIMNCSCSMSVTTRFSDYLSVSVFYSYISSVMNRGLRETTSVWLTKYLKRSLVFHMLTSGFPTMKANSRTHGQLGKWKRDAVHDLLSGECKYSCNQSTMVSIIFEVSFKSHAFSN